MSSDSNVQSPAGSRRQRWNRFLWGAWVIVFLIEMWPIRDLIDTEAPFIGPFPFSVFCQFAIIGCWIAIYCLWMSKVWLADDGEAVSYEGDATHE